MSAKKVIRSSFVSLYEKFLEKNIKIKFRNRYFFIIDLLIFILVPVLALVIRFEGFNFNIPIQSIVAYCVLFTAVNFLILFSFGIYSRWWDKASIHDLLTLIYLGAAILFAQFILLFVIKLLPANPLTHIPTSAPVISAILSGLFISLSRISIRLFTYMHQVSHHRCNSSSKRTLIVGAGDAGVMVLEELRRKSDPSTEIIGFIDDSKYKAGKYIRGIKVLGKKEDIPEIVAENNISKILIAIPSSAGRAIKSILDICDNIPDLEILTLPPLYDIINGKVEINKLRKVQIEDLLKRNPIHSNLDAIVNMLKGKNVLVTGAGGSIGSEICRQILKCNPNCLYLLGHGENSIFDIENELQKKYPKNQIVSFIADIKDINRLEYIFDNHRIDFVFHAAAHKHVPLMENQPYEAIKNNIFGTKNLVDIAVEYDVEKFIMISTDKAINPSSVMGATKRTAEMVVINAANKYNKKFSIVRFGNVLGSRGSFLETLKTQIKYGGPVTVTHPDMKRFFMSIPEAVQLVIEAFVIGNGGDVFVFDMGEPFKVIDLVKNLIHLSGLKLGEDIEIEIIGLRPGEKLFEELFAKNESYSKTANENIYIAENISKLITPFFNEHLIELNNLVNSEKLDNNTYMQYLKLLVPEYAHEEMQLDKKCVS